MKYLVVGTEDKCNELKEKLDQVGIAETECYYTDNLDKAIETIKEKGIEVAVLESLSGFTKKIHVQCFGNFEAFDSDGHPIIFKRSKSKELLAYLIDRMGAMVDVGQIRAALWEESVDKEVKKSYTRNLISDLRRALRALGCEDVLLSAHNSYGIDRSKVSCDYYDYLNGTGSTNYRGEYMYQYSWAESTHAILDKMTSGSNK